MHPLVLREGRALHEGFPTVLTDIRLLSRVDFFMYRKVPWISEQLPTYTASANLAPTMDFYKHDLWSPLADGFLSTVALCSSVLLTGLLVGFRM